MKKFPRIFDYLQVYHKAVAEMLENLSMQGALNPRRGGAITFLIPDSDYVKEINKILEGPNPEEATNIVSALILTLNLPDVAAFNKFQSDIPNMLGKKLVVKGITNKGVEVDNGLLTLDEKFQPFSHVGGVPRNNMAVWKLKGKININTPKATYEHNKEVKKGAKLGGASSSSAESAIQALRQQLMDMKLLAVRNGPNDFTGEECPLSRANSRLIRGFEKNRDQYTNELCLAQCFLTCEPTIDFMLLFCNPLMFSPEKVMMAYNTSAELAGDAIKALCEGKHCNDDSGAVFLTKAGREKYAAVRCKLVKELLQTSNIDNVIDRVKRLYSEIDTKNRLVDPISGKHLLDDKPVYPNAVVDVFSKNANLHQLLDEVKCRIYIHLREMVNMQKIYADAKNPTRRTFRENAYKELFGILRGCYNGCKLDNSGGSLEDMCIFLSKQRLETLVNGTGRALPEAFKAFATSAMLCHHDLTVVGAGKKVSKVNTDEDMDDEEALEESVENAQGDVSRLSMDTGMKEENALDDVRGKAMLLSKTQRSQLIKALNDAERDENDV